MELTPAYIEKTNGESLSADGRPETTANHAHENPMNEIPLQGDILQRHTNTTKNNRSLKRQSSQHTYVNNVVQKITWYNTIGSRGLLILACTLAIAVLHFFVAYESTRKFTYMNREGIWVFFVFAVLYGFLFLRFVLRWKHFASDWLKTNYTDQTYTQNSHVIYQLRNWYIDYFGLERGKFYFWRLYSFELIENYVQLHNMITMYLCMLPLSWCMVFSSILICESLIRVYIMSKKIWFSKNQNITVFEKDFQLALDIFIDLFFLVTPITVTYLGYGLWLSIEEWTLMLVFPTISLFGKLKRIMDENMHQYLESMLMKELNSASIKRTRNRVSLFGKSFNDKVTQTQNRWFPHWAKVIVFALSVCYIVFFVVLVAVQAIRSSLSTASLQCHTFISDNRAFQTYWNEGCKVKVPFCNKLFEPTCNCAVLKIKDHNITKISDKFVRLTALRIVIIESGTLETLPKNMEKLVHMNRLNLDFNRLKSFDVDVLQWKDLSQMRLDFNNITQYNENLWVHPQLVNLLIGSNPGLQISKKVFLPRLMFLDVSNNSVSIPELKLPAINYLYLGGNLLSQLPTNIESWKDTLMYLGVARCGLKSLEKISTLKKLIYLDARNNSLRSVSNEVKSMINLRKGFESYFSGNPVCEIDLELNCARLYSNIAESSQSIIPHSAEQGFRLNEIKPTKSDKVEVQYG
eukprot:g13083.t1